jgi:UDP-N-acetylglucosamine--N-acetylmuramyl-(pentapeptide) pyrophosphoryl-undecaprenol N-acetylglucosamine transferase
MTAILIAGGGTGGHLMPALAVAAALRRAHPEHEVVLAGAERGLEARLLPGRSFPYHLLPAEPLYRRQWWKNARGLFRIPRLLGRVNRVLDEVRPGVALGTGGYAAAAVIWRAAGRRIPTALLELDAVPGLATRVLARRAKHVYLAMPEAAARLPAQRGQRVFVTGAPIEPPDPGLRAGARERFGLDGRPVVLVTGGSQGSAAINAAVEGWVASGGARAVQVIWATGPDHLERHRRHHAPPDVQVHGFLDPIAPAYAVADLAVARAGSMSLAELAAWGIPAILVPLPGAAADHQTRNALAMTEAGAAVVLPQAELSPGTLAAAVDRLVDDPIGRDRMAACALARGKPGATVDIVSLLTGLEAGS